MYQREGKDAWWREAGTYTSAASTPGASLLEGTGLSPADAQLNSDPFKWVRSGTAPPPVQTSPDPSQPGSRLLGLLGKAGSPSPGNRKAAAAARLGGANQRHGFQFHSCLLKMSGLETVRHADWVRCGEQLCVPRESLDKERWLQLVAAYDPDGSGAIPVGEVVMDALEPVAAELITCLAQTVRGLSARVDALTSAHEKDLAQSQQAKVQIALLPPPPALGHRPPVTSCPSLTGARSRAACR